MTSQYERTIIEILQANQNTKFSTLYQRCCFQFFQQILFRLISQLRIIKNLQRKYSQYRRDFYNLVVSIFIFHECNCGIKELQIIYLNNKKCSPCAFLSRFYKASINFFAKRAHSKTPAEKRTDCTLSDKILLDKSHEIFWG